VHGGGHAIEEQVAAVRQDSGDAGVNGITSGDRRLTDLHASDIGDGVQRARREDSGRDAEIAGTRPGGLCRPEGGRGGEDDQDKMGEAHGE